MKIALIGLGKLGIEIAGVLARAGHDLTVWNRTRSKADGLLGAGARAAATPWEAARGAEVVLNVVLDDAAFEQVTFGPDGILAGLGQDAVHAGLSTISLALAKRVGRAHAEADRRYIGAPVFGLPEAARAAKLIVVAGGDAGAIARAQPVFDTIARLTVTAGPEPWSGLIFKLGGNFMIHSMAETFTEAQALVRTSGLEPSAFVEVMAELWGSPMYRNYGMRLAEGKYDAAAVAKAITLKDNGLLLEAAREFRVPMPVGDLVRKQMLAAVEQSEARHALQS